MKKISLLASVSAALALGFGAGITISRSHESSQALKGVETPAGKNSQSASNREPKAKNSTNPSSIDGPIGSLLNSAFTEQSEIRATRHFMGALNQHNRENSKKFESYFSAHPFRKHHFHFWRLFFSSWGSFDPAGAIAYIQGRFEQLPLRQEFYLSVLRSWHRESPEEALASAGKILLPEGETHHQLALSYLEAVMKEDVALALRGMVRLTDHEAVLEMAGLQLKELAKGDIQSALAQLSASAPEKGETQNFLTGQLLSIWATKDPVAATKWLADNGFPQISPGDLQEMMAQYVKKDPSAAFEWLNSLPDNLFNEDLLSSSARAWAATDPSGIRDWLSSHQPSKESDPVVSSLAQTLASTDPRAALSTASKYIHDPVTGQETFYHIAQEWQQKEPEAFEEWLHNTPDVSPAQKQRLLTREFHGNNAAPSTTTPPIPQNDGRDVE